MRFVIFGAGATGGVIGGHLARNDGDVLLVCREEHADAISSQKGLRIKSATGEYVAPLSAVTALSPGDVADDDWLFLTVKSNHTEGAVNALADLVPPGTRIVSFQNGVTNEDVIARRFDNVYGGVIRMTCSFLQEGQVSFRKAGRLVVGRHPKGADPHAKRLAALLCDAGFDAACSNRISCDKWLKLVVNLQSGWHAVVDTRDHDSPDFTALKVGILEEARAVLKAGKIKAQSIDGKDPSIDELIEELKRPHLERQTHGVRVNNSTWQNLYMKRPDVENSYFHAPIMDIAREHDVPVPFNEAALEAVLRCHREGAGPNTLRASELLADINGRSTAA